ncbi:TPA: PKD domain-containing protein [Candidatus Woesearchaeota archaeon]|nr:PKD domain-containing protein [Candidatus Woesearchaeota archaeon]
MIKREFVFGIVFCFLFLSVAAEQMDMKATPVDGTAPLVVSFEVSPAEDITSYQWDFNGDGVSDSADPNPTYTYAQEGSFTPTVTVQTSSGEVNLTTIITVLSRMSATVVANPSSGIAPLGVQFTLAATGREPLQYAWDYNADGIIDSTQQNPQYIFDAPGSYNISVTITDVTGNSLLKVVPVSALKFDSQLQLDSYFPTTLDLGENKITFILLNGGTKALENINAKIIGNGVQHLASTTVSRLEAGDQDSVVVTVNVLSQGVLPTKVKLLDKTFSLNFTTNVKVEYSLEDIQNRFNEIKVQLQELEKEYHQKKAEGYLVSELFDSVKSAKAKLEMAQQQILTRKLADAQVNLDVIKSSLVDINQSLADVQKQEKRPLDWVKDNIAAIAVIITSLGAVSGFLIKLKSHAKKVGEKAAQVGGQAFSKVGDAVKDKVKGKKEKDDSADKKHSERSSSSSSLSITSEETVDEKK